VLPGSPAEFVPAGECGGQGQVIRTMEMAVRVADALSLAG
jgi:hypothetical protein